MHGGGRGRCPDEGLAAAQAPRTSRSSHTGPYHQAPGSPSIWKVPWLVREQPSSKCFSLGAVVPHPRAGPLGTGSRNSASPGLMLCFALPLPLIWAQRLAGPVSVQLGTCPPSLLSSSRCEIPSRVRQRSLRPPTWWRGGRQWPEGGKGAHEPPVTAWEASSRFISFLSVLND